jgi:hypothetical protein
VYIKVLFHAQGQQFQGRAGIVARGERVDQRVKSGDVDITF